MQPSSLVFLVIIAVWAAYFLQYWVRRREHLATARSVDQFSESMRVLERRSPLPASNLSTPQPRSYAVTPARVARPQVLVKRADTSVPSATSAAAAPATPGTRGQAPVASEPAAPAARPSSARRTRAVIMLGALATVVATLSLVALALVPVYALVLPVAAVGGALAWSRADAQARRRARAAARQAARPAASPRVDVNAPGITGGFTSNPEKIEPVEGPAPASAPAAPHDELYDVQAVETTGRQPAPVEAPVATAPVAPPRPLVDEDDIPLTWDPVPVPRPTYTMKARVTRPAPTSADLVGDADTEYAAYEETPERRVAGA